MAITMSTPKTQRLTLADMDHLSTGKKARLHRLLYDYGPGNGTLLFLPIDQGLEHGPVDFFVNQIFNAAWRWKANIPPSCSISASLKNT